jgi:hypothetical protein
MFKFVVMAAALMAAPALADTGKTVTIIVDNSQYCGMSKYDEGMRHRANRELRKLVREQKALGNTVNVVTKESRYRTQVNADPLAAPIYRSTGGGC